MSSIINIWSTGTQYIPVTTQWAWPDPPPPEPIRYCPLDGHMCFCIGSCMKLGIIPNTQQIPRPGQDLTNPFGRLPGDDLTNPTNIGPNNIFGPNSETF